MSSPLTTKQLLGCYELQRQQGQNRPCSGKARGSQPNQVHTHKLETRSSTNQQQLDPLISHKPVPVEPRGKEPDSAGRARDSQPKDNEHRVPHPKRLLGLHLHEPPLVRVVVRLRRRAPRTAAAGDRVLPVARRLVIRLRAEEQRVQPRRQPARRLGVAVDAPQRVLHVDEHEGEDKGRKVDGRHDELLADDRRASVSGGTWHSRGHGEGPRRCKWPALYRVDGSWGPSRPLPLPFPLQPEVCFDDGKDPAEAAVPAIAATGSRGRKPTSQMNLVFPGSPLPHRQAVRRRALLRARM